MSERNDRSPTTARYLRAFFGLMCLGLAVLSALNYFVDPFGVYRPGWTQSLDKFRDSDFRRVQVGELLHRQTWDTVFLGSSRAYISVDPRWPMWRTDRALNAGIAAGTIKEEAAIGRYALEHTGVRHVYLFADFFSFNDAVEPLLDFDRSRLNPGITPAGYHLRNLVSIDSTRKSIEVLQNMRANRSDRSWVNGYQLRTFSARYPEQRTEIYNSIDNYLRSPNFYASFRAYTQSLGAMVDLARECRARGATFAVVVLPVHAFHLEAVRAAGLWPLFESWERDVASALAAEGAAARAEPFPFWDFTAYRGAPAEPVPAKAEDSPAMAYFRDDAHPLPELSRLCMRCAMGQREKDPADGGPLGEQVTPGNVDEHLRRIREEREVYAAAHPQDVAWVEKIAKEAAVWTASHVPKDAK